MTGWYTASVLALAPDATARTAAQRLGLDRWSDLGFVDRCAWGRCSGSAPQPYATVVALESPPAASCSCPSRKVPCKHALSLLLLLGRGEVPRAAREPSYASAWLGARDRGREGQTPPPTPSGDPEAAARRRAARTKRVTAGLEELERWLGDQVRGGLAALERAGYAHFDAIAARMVDAQAPGVASVLRAVPGELVGPGWPDRVLEALGGLHLLVQAHQRLDALPADLAATVRSRVGYPVAKDAVLAEPAVADRWWAVGAVDTVEYQLTTRRVWLRGLTTGRWAMWLTFAPPGQSLDSTLGPGLVFDGELHFYPGRGQHRALLGAGQVSADSAGVEGPAWGQTVAEVQAAFAELVAADPWSTRMPALVEGQVRPDRGRGPSWRLNDRDGGQVELRGLAGEPWPLLAQSVSGPVVIVGEWDGRSLRPLSTLTGDRVLTGIAA
ncbi:MAG: SWIM zinc finger family protein [Actinomycetes bacterium]